ncbi:MAG: ABC transporter ATP-binding protein [Hyphomicrobiales bacterium]|nr:ABC transporter ATP-binding protein [Hyphomicrobiales bacterium]
MSAIIAVDRITKRYGGLTVLDACSLEVPRGAITGLIGPNGAGKTTLFNIIAGVTRPDEGHVFFDGSEVTGKKPHELFGLGLTRTFQIPKEWARMTVIENLMVVPPRQTGEGVFAAWFEGGRVRQEERAILGRAEATLEVLGLFAHRAALAGTLSGGQKKLLELGRTMMVDSKLVLLDEPGAGVNRTLLGDLAHHIERLHRERGTSFCIIEHDMDLIARLCDPVVVMAEGRVLAKGKMAEIKADARVREAYLGTASAGMAAA